MRLWIVGHISFGTMKIKAEMLVQNTGKFFVVCVCVWFSYGCLPFFSLAFTCFSKSGQNMCCGEKPRGKIKVVLCKTAMGGNLDKILCESKLKKVSRQAPLQEIPFSVLGLGPGISISNKLF